MSDASDIMVPREQWYLIRRTDGAWMLCLPVAHLPATQPATGGAPRIEVHREHLRLNSAPPLRLCGLSAAAMVVLCMDSDRRGAVPVLLVGVDTYGSPVTAVRTIAILGRRPAASGEVE